MSNVTKNRSKSSPELLVLGRCQRLLEGLSPSQASRVARWLLDSSEEARYPVLIARGSGTLAEQAEKQGYIPFG